MRFALFFLLLCSMAPVAGAAQRLLDLRPGVPCDKISETERILGSVETAVNGPDGASEYTGTQGGLEASMVYICENGLLAEQRILVTAASREAAYRFANGQKAELVRQFGSPVHDGFDLDIWSRLYFGFKGSDLDYLSEVVVWGKAKEDVMLSVRQKGEARWEITISQGSPKQEFNLNL